MIRTFPLPTKPVGARLSPLLSLWTAIPHDHILFGSCAQHFFKVASGRLETQWGFRKTIDADALACGDYDILKTERYTIFNHSNLSYRIDDHIVPKGTRAVDVLPKVDFTIAQFVMDQEFIYTTDQAISDLDNMRLRYVPNYDVSKQDRPRLAARLYKYTCKGFTPDPEMIYDAVAIGDGWDSIDPLKNSLPAHEVSRFTDHYGGFSDQFTFRV